SAWPYTGSQDGAKTMTTTNSRSIHPQQRVSATNLAPPDETRRPVGVRRWAARIAKFLLPTGLFAISVLGVIVSPVQAAPPAQAKYSFIHALTALMKAGTVIALAQRNDVVSVSPNREVRQTASTLESITGALTGNVRPNSTKTSYSGMDGTGIGIAVLDSGVMKAHDAFLDGNGVTRVARNVDMFNSV